MTAINANMSNSQDWLPLSEADAVAIAPGFYTIGSENIEIQGLHRAATLTTSPFNGRWCARAIAGSSAASHTSGASLTRYYPDAPATGGGGSISATDGTTTVNPMTSLRLPAGTLSDLGGGVGGMGLVLSFQTATFAFDTAGLNNPSDLGAGLIDVPAGSLVQAFAMIDTGWDQSGELILSLSSPDLTTEAQTLAGYTAQGDTSNAHARIESVTTFPTDPGAIRRWGYAILDCVVSVSFFPDADNPTQGSGHLFAIVASPAS